MNDYTKDLTVFHITCGASSLVKSRKSLLDQTCKFNLVTIKDIQPIWKAFQFMHTNCKTPFFIQVDEDMILNKDAVEIMFLYIVETPSSIASLIFPLYDCHLKRNVGGVRINRFAWNKRFPYRDVRHIEFDQYKRIIRNGGQVKNIDQPIVGTHGEVYTQMEIFERYKHATENFKHTTPINVARERLYVLAKRLGITEEQLESQDFWAFLGVLSGLLSDTPLGGARKRADLYRIDGYAWVRTFVLPEPKYVWHKDKKKEFVDNGQCTEPWNVLVYNDQGEISPCTKIEPSLQYGKKIDNAWRSNKWISNIRLYLAGGNIESPEPCKTCHKNKRLKYA